MSGKNDYEPDAADVYSRIDGLQHCRYSEITPSLESSRL